MKYFWLFGIPVIIQTILYWFWKNIVVHNLKTKAEEMENLNLYLRIALSLFALFLFFTEFSKILLNDRKGIWRSFDSIFIGIITSVLVIMAVSMIDTS